MTLKANHQLLIAIHLIVANLNTHNMKTWLDKWDPEDEIFWKKTGSKIAWKTLLITTSSLIMSF